VTRESLFCLSAALRWNSVDDDDVVVLRMLAWPWPWDCWPYSHQCLFDDLGRP